MAANKKALNCSGLEIDINKILSSLAVLFLFKSLLALIVFYKIIKLFFFLFRLNLY